MIGQVRITFCPIFRVDKTSIHEGLGKLLFYPDEDYVEGIQRRASRFIVGKGSDL